MNLAVVAVHYRVPESRLREFFSWNDAAFRAAGARVIIVSDVPRDGLPEYAETVVFPVPLKMFSISRTANFGIRRAIDQGAGVVLKTDIDCVLDTLHALVTAVDGEAAWSPYRMVADLEDRGKVWNSARGTVCLTAGDWQRLNGYDERMSGYGVDDGDLRSRARHAGIRWRRCEPLRHVSGTGEKFTTSGNRRDRWNYDATNPLNHAANRAATKTPWTRAEWGKF